MSQKLGAAFHSQGPAVQGEVIVVAASPCVVGVFFIISRAPSIYGTNPARRLCLILRAVFCQNALHTNCPVRIEEYPQAGRVIPQDVIRAAAHDDTGAFVCQFPDDTTLRLEHLIFTGKIAQMAVKYHVSVAQLCIRYDLQLGLVVLPKTANPDHMKSNAQMDFVISGEDMEALKNIERIKDYGESSGFPVYGGKM